MAGGHLIKNALSLKICKKRQTETLIVGGGLAGLAAAHALKNKDYMLLELDDRFGGSHPQIIIKALLWVAVLIMT